MSHNVDIKNVKITDVNALQKAVDELAKEGVKISFEKDAVFRSYNERLSQRADYVIKLPDSPYDVGLNKSQDGVLVPRFDNYRGHVAAQIGAQAGAKDVSGQACMIGTPEAAIGRLYQRYNVIVAEKTAAQKGMVTQRRTSANGIMQVVGVMR